MRHLLVRPTWTCVVDGRDWPCLGAQLELEADYLEAPLALAEYMGGHLEHAIAELELEPHEIHTRLLGWVKPRRSVS